MNRRIQFSNSLAFLSSISLALIAGILLACLAIVTTPVYAAGLMTPANSTLPELEIKQHHVEVTIEDGYAITQVTQIFFNPHDTTLEAIYSFPIPEKAAVGEFTYWIDGKPVTGEVLEKQQARDIYEQEKAQGRETAITEQDEYKTFDSSVYPVLPRQDVKIRLVYIQPVHVDHGIGSYTYPLEEGGTDEEKLAFWSYNEAVSEAFRFNLNLRSSYPIEDIRLPKHPQAVATSTSKQEWQVALVNGQAASTATAGAAVTDEEGNTASSTLTQGVTQTVTPQIVHTLDQDIVVYWRHAQGLPGSVDMVAHKAPGESRGTFMMTITPGDDLKPIHQGRDWAFVLDYSGSMQGKYHSLVEGVKKGLHKLNPNDRFRIILFNNSAFEITNGYTAATPEQVQQSLTRLEREKPTGSTNLYDGVEQGLNGLDADRPSAIVLVTDGVANVGTTEKQSFLDLMDKHDVRLFTFIMGNSANRPLLEGMTKISNGFAMNVSNSDDIVGKLLLATQKLTHEAFHDVEVEFDGVKVTDLTPERIGSVYRGQQIILFGHYRGDGMADVRITAKVSGQPVDYKTRFAFPNEETRNPEIERLWAYATIEAIENRMDYLGPDADSKQAIIDIAKQYSLVTNYTSMVVVREEVFKQLNIERRNEKRVAAERQAKQQRAVQPVQDNRRDAQQPAFTNNRSYPSSGGGAFAPWSLLMLLPLAIAFVRRKNNRY